MGRKRGVERSAKSRNAEQEWFWRRPVRNTLLLGVAVVGTLLAVFLLFSFLLSDPLVFLVAVAIVALAAFLAWCKK